MTQVDPRVLAAIGNPTGGRLTQMAQDYNTAKNRAEESQRRDAENKRATEKAEMFKKKFMQEQAITGAKVGKVYAQDAMDWYDKRVEEGDTPSDEEFRDYQLEIAQRFDQAHQAFIPERLQGRNELQAGYERFDNLLNELGEPTESVDQYSPLQKVEGTDFYAQENLKTGKLVNLKKSKNGSPVGNSEFERVLGASLKAGKIDRKRYDELMLQRTEGLAGEMTNKDITKFGEQKRKSGVAETKDLRKEYSDGVEHFKNMDNTINEAFIAMESGNTGLSDVMLNRVMSQVQDDNIRAYAAMQQFDKPFGNLANRITESIEKFLSGKRSDAEKAEIRSTLRYFQEAYAQPKRQSMRDRYRAMAVEGGNDPFTVVPPTSKEEIRDSTLIDRKRKKELLILHYPREFKK